MEKDVLQGFFRVIPFQCPRNNEIVLNERLVKVFPDCLRRGRRHGTATYFTVPGGYGCGLTVFEALIVFEIACEGGQPHGLHRFRPP